MAVRYELNTERPFIAIRNDVAGDRYTPSAGEYLVNSLEEDLHDVKVSSGGFYSTDLGVITTDGHPQNGLIVPARGFLRVGLSTWDEYDELVVSWRVEFATRAPSPESAAFGSYKGLADASYVDDIPILGGPGWIVPREIIY